jgi:hypothetical protein
MGMTANRPNVTDLVAIYRDFPAPRNRKERRQLEARKRILRNEISRRWAANLGRAFVRFGLAVRSFLGGLV